MRLSPSLLMSLHVKEGKEMLFTVGKTYTVAQTSLQRFCLLIEIIPKLSGKGPHVSSIHKGNIKMLCAMNDLEVSETS